MSATATRHEGGLNALRTPAMHANFDEPQASAAGATCQNDVAANGAGVPRESRGYQFLMSFLRVMSAFNA